MMSSATEKFFAIRYLTFKPARAATSFMTSIANPTGLPLSSTSYCGGHVSGTTATIVLDGGFAVAGVLSWAMALGAVVHNSDSNTNANRSDIGGVDQCLASPS